MNDFNNNEQNNFYSKKSDDIIQDNLYQENTNPPPVYTPPTYSQNFNNDKYQKPPKFKKPKTVHSTGTVILSCIIAAAIGATSGVVAMFGYSRLSDNINNAKPSENATITETEPAPEQSEGSPNININVDEDATSIAEAVAKKCTNSVVGIRTTTSVSSFFGGSQEQSGEGSGVIYTADGYIITNYHVIGDAVESNNARVEVFIGNSKGTSYPAKVIGYNISCDLAVIKIEANNLTPIEFANSDELEVGQYVITIGAPGGLEFMGSVTYGIVSGLDREVSTDNELELIQTDAAINPGNSGGALLNAEGKLVGINSAKIVSEEFEGMGFAIPSNAVKEKCDDIMSNKNESGAYLGVSVSKTYTADVLELYNYPAGAVVSSVAYGSPAEKAGIERGDIITEFNGVKITEYPVLDAQLGKCKPGDTVKVKIYRNGKISTVKVTLTAEGS